VGARQAAKAALIAIFISLLPISAEAAPRRLPARGEHVFDLIVPDIGLREEVVAGIGQAELRNAVGKYPACREGFPPPYCTRFEERWPGEDGAVYLGGHRTLEEKPFFHLGRLKRGDEILLSTQKGTFRYAVTRQEVVDDGDLSIVVPRTRPMVVLITCHPKYSAEERMIVYARELPARPQVPTPR
jgi:LPXTG-site transpeptidase (sortase) family protein